MRNFMMFVGLAAAVAACDMFESAQNTANEAADAAADAANEAADEAADAAGAAADAVQAEADKVATNLKDLMAETAGSMGKDIVVAGNFASAAVSEGDDGTTVTLTAGTAEGAPTITCMVSADNKAQFENMESEAMVQVKGTLTDKDGKPVIENCSRIEVADAAEAAGAMAEEAVEEAAEAAEGDGH